MTWKAGVTRTIYIVDDDAMFCHNLSLQLSSLGYSVFYYMSPVHFLLEITPGSYGCIILDIDMPDMDGLTVQKRINDLDIYSCTARICLPNLTFIRSLN